MSRLLLADDDQALSEMLSEYLRSENFSVIQAFDGATALQLALQEPFDLLILDIMMPNKNGFDLLRELRRHQSTPVLMLTARGDEIDRIVGLEMGADDYLPKPCNPRELVARIRAILRRLSDSRPLHNNQPLKVGELELHPGARKALLNNRPLELTSSEYTILELLLRHPGQIVSKEQLSEQALGRPLARYDRSIDMHISNLRKKLGCRNEQQSRIQTIRNQGYLFSSE